ncbi:hypothetical protein FKM82_020290 [Ascaphus truei]
MRPRGVRRHLGDSACPLGHVFVAAERIWRRLWRLGLLPSVACCGVQTLCRAVCCPIRGVETAFFIVCFVRVVRAPYLTHHLR